MTAAADELGFAHPYISRLARELEREGLAASRADPRDRRSRTITLTRKGRALAKDLDPIWKGVQKAVEEVFPESGADLLKVLGAMERAFDEEPLARRIGRHRGRRPLEESGR